MRERLPQYGTVQDAVNLITASRRILVLTGAGISKYEYQNPRVSRLTMRWDKVYLVEFQTFAHVMAYMQR